MLWSLSQAPKLSENKTKQKNQTSNVEAQGNE